MACANSKEAATGDRKRLSMVNILFTLRHSARHYLWMLKLPLTARPAMIGYQSISSTWQQASPARICALITLLSAHPQLAQLATLRTYSPPQIPSLNSLPPSEIRRISFSVGLGGLSAPPSEVGARLVNRRQSVSMARHMM